MRSEAREQNEALFRNVNEQIEAISQTLPTVQAMEYLCECDDLNCQNMVWATPAEYESVRAEPTHFIVLPTHVDPRVEHVVSLHDRFAVVEKEGAAATKAKENDPRERA